MKLKTILKQLIYALIMAFESKGFIHGYIENILLYKLKETKRLEYQIENIKYYIDTDVECIIMDFDKSITYTLIQSIINIINICGKLYAKDKKYDIDPIRNILNKSYSLLHYDIVLDGISILGSFYSQSRDYDEFIKLSVHDTIQFLNIYWKELYNEYLFPSHSLEFSIKKSSK